MALARDFSGKIREFLRLAAKLDLSRPEELTLLAAAAPEWHRWRSMTVPPDTAVPQVLERRMDYALYILKRMAASHEPE